jgi:hypothetical protein
MFDLRDVATYMAKRVGLTPCRVGFGAGNAINAKLTAQQRRNFLRFLNRHELKRFLVSDDFHKRQLEGANHREQTRKSGQQGHYLRWPDLPGNLRQNKLGRLCQSGRSWHNVRILKPDWWQRYGIKGKGYPKMGFVAP